MMDDDAYLVRPFDPAIDMGALLELLNGAAQYLRSKGVLQWDEFMREDIENDVIAGNAIFLVIDRHSADLVGTFSLKPQDELQWTDDDPAESPKTAYFYRYSVHPNHLGKNVGGRIFLAIEAHVRHALQIQRLRLDCWAGNMKLRSYYHEQGFHHLGDQPEVDYHVSLFEKDWSKL